MAHLLIYLLIVVNNKLNLCSSSAAHLFPIVICITLNETVPLMEHCCKGSMQDLALEKGLNFKTTLAGHHLGCLCELSNVSLKLGKFRATKADTLISWVTPQGCSWPTPRYGRCASIWHSLVIRNPANFTEISYLFSCQIYQLVLVQTGILQFCLDEWLAFKTHSRQGPWQMTCKDVCFDFSRF